MNEPGPTPWTIRPRLVDAGFDVVADATGRTIGAITLREDAALVVEAVNNLAPLRSSGLALMAENHRLRHLLRRLCDTFEPFAWDGFLANDCEKQRAALLREAAAAADPFGTESPPG